MNKPTLGFTALTGLALVSIGGHASAGADTCAAPSDTDDLGETAAPPAKTDTTAAPSHDEQPARCETPARGDAHHTAMFGIGVGLSAGGGIDDYVGSTMRETTGIGGGWAARATFGTRSYIAGELAYIGSAQSIQRLGLTGRSTMYGNGAQAVLRVNATVAYAIQPFIYGGVAWRHYSLSTSTANFSDVVDSTDTFEVPLGIGLATYAHGIMFDLRGEYRFCWADHAIVPDSSGGTPNLDRWAVISSAGVAF